MKVEGITLLWTDFSQVAMSNELAPVQDLLRAFRIKSRPRSPTLKRGSFQLNDVIHRCHIAVFSSSLRHILLYGVFQFFRCCRTFVQTVYGVMSKESHILTWPSSLPSLSFSMTI